MRYLTLCLTASALALSACENPPERLKNQPVEEPALEQSLHERILTLDTHIDIPLDYMVDIDPQFPTALQVDIPKMKAGALDSGFFIIYTPQGELSPEGYEAALEIAQTRYRAIQNLATAYPEDVEIATTASEVRAIVAGGRRAVLLGMENAYPLGADVRNGALWARRGVRYMGLTHFGHNQFGDSSNPNPERDSAARHDGLSDKGRQLISVLNKNGVMIDVSHAGKDTMMQAADVSATPIIASHSGVKAVGDSARNLDDEQLLKIAAVGGVAQMVALGVYVKPLSPAQENFRTELRREMGLESSESRASMDEQTQASYEKRLQAIYDIEPEATVADFVDHIDHAVKVAGIDHVGIASDFDGGGRA